MRYLNDTNGERQTPEIPFMKVPADGSAPPTQLTSTSAMYYNTAWAPDGQRIVAARELKDAAGIFFGPIGGEFVWVSSNGGDVNVISPTGFRNVPDFASDEPDRIYAYSPVEGLVSFHWDGTDVKQHLIVRGTPIPGGIANLHPDEWEFLPRHVFPWRKAPDPTDPDPSTEPGGPPPAGLVMLSPSGDRAFAQVGSDIYVVDLAEVGSTPPTVTLANLAGAPVPVRKLTDVGGEFPAWAPDGQSVHWAMGNVLFTCDLAGVEADEEAEEATAHEGALLRVRAAAVSDSL